MSTAAANRDRVLIERDRVVNGVTQNVPGLWTDDEEIPFDLARFKSQEFELQVIKLSETTIEFDVKGVDASFANALRRIMIAEVPSMAAERVYMMNNTSVIYDEVLASRLGLIPIRVDHAEFDWAHDDAPTTDMNTIVFKLNVKCEPRKDVPKGEIDPEKKYINANVYSRQLEWIPKGTQGERFVGPNVIRPVHGNILIAKLRPGQEIDCEIHCVKGIGQDHAKFSPVATATYRLMPEIVIKKTIPPHLVDKFAGCFPKGVIEVYTENGVKKCRVANPRLDTISREVLRHEEFEDMVELKRIRDHYIFKVQSTGCVPPERIVYEALSTLSDKCDSIYNGLAFC
ncbi:DNA-directed RNA polymerases I and III subunit RPAC1 [Ramicandelaber brevisporus]|nr:DNA-directed RNA polymerases I and III subunit RPAC1 [Ramicandelaber brevisporus]KAI8870126.1 DNA-directed RNA polymerases I and III subunit RPAC1 [Ramicandelaber brevisporus]